MPDAYRDPAVPAPPQYDLYNQQAELIRRIEALEHHEHTAQSASGLQLGGNIGNPCNSVGVNGVSGNAAKDDHIHQGLLKNQASVGLATSQGVTGTGSGTSFTLLQSLTMTMSALTGVAIVTGVFDFQVVTANSLALGYLFVDVATPTNGTQQPAQATLQGLARSTSSQTWIINNLAQGSHTFRLAAIQVGGGVNVIATHTTLNVVLLG